MQEDINSNGNSTAGPHQSLGKSILLHIAPGLVTLAALIGIKPLTEKMGFPPLMAFLVAVLLIDIPFMVGVMLAEGKKLNGRLSLKGIILFRRKTGWKAFTLVFIGGFALLYLAITLSAPINDVVTKTAFTWLPDWFYFDDPGQYEGFSRNTLLIVFTLQLVITGFILPWVEELYFRGFLLPRMSGLRAWAPLVSGLLFGFYHAWQLYGWVGVSLLGIGLGYIVWWKKDVRLGISLHVLANAIVRIMLLMQVLSM